MILPNCDDSRSASIVEHMLKLMGRPLTLGDRDVTVSTCIGIAQYPRDATNPETLVSHADLALHRAKVDGLNRFQFYQSMMRDRSQEDLQLDTALHGALERNELHLVFQPIVRSADRSMAKVEALLRWQSPTLGAVPPACFIPLLERNGLIVPVGRWVLATACREVAALKPGQGATLRLAVNVSARQLVHPDFVTDVKAVLEDTGLDADRLELEVTESVLIENAVVAADVLRALCRLRVTIAADDFGTGYSSLSYLWKFPFSTLKIDRSFVSALITDNHAKTIVSSILGLADDLGLSVVAEGIETPIQFEMLKTLGCPLIQGYWTGRPMPMAAIKEGMMAATDTELVRTER
ncbi:MAG: EAL domain-containing protein [Rhodocyclales bacterium]|nr:EAL domain-containing protein [Rhodocyclales bacterium]